MCLNAFRHPNKHLNDDDKNDLNSDQGRKIKKIIRNCTMWCCKIIPTSLFPPKYHLPPWIIIPRLPAQRGTIRSWSAVTYFQEEEMLLQFLLVNSSQFDRMLFHELSTIEEQSCGGFYTSFCISYPLLRDFPLARWRLPSLHIRPTQHLGCKHQHSGQHNTWVASTNIRSWGRHS
jgi:hypothetical protein